ncbi:hypothetical protein BDR06DRAFT_983321 [Suillus hirtellus]|nr:hypothetical protein BDR06DRAFT_983321 [Suillus hirtellus]
MLPLLVLYNHLQSSLVLVTAYHCDVYKTINSTPLDDMQWQSCLVKYTREHAVDDTTPWIEDSYNVWFHDPHDVVQNMLANPDYALEMDLQPYRKFMTETDKHQWQDFMSGDWAWNQADKISDDPDTHGSTFVPVILGSNKTMVSVATGQNDYYPLYTSIRNVHTNVCHAHHNAVAVIGFLAMPKTTKQHAKTANFCNFCHQLFHSSLSYILKNLKPEIACFGDNHYHHVIYGLGLYIADYEEQVLLACIAKNWCAKCLSYHKSLDNDSLQCSRTHTKALIKECDNLVLWDEFGIAAQFVPFTNDFPHANIHELIAPDFLHQIIKGTFKDHLVVWVEKYLVQMHGQTQADVILDDIDRRIAAVPAFSGLHRFPQGCNFQQWTRDNSKALMKKTLAEIDDALAQFHQYCKIFNHYKTLGQMLVTNQHLDKLTASHQDFWAHKMLNGTCLSSLSTELNIPNLAKLVQWFLFEQSNPNDACDHTKVTLLESPYYQGQISVFNSASSTFHAPSDLSGIGGMKREHIHTCPLWRNKCAHNDCVFVITDSDTPRMGDMDVAHPAFSANCTPHFAVIHIDTIFCTAHLIPVYGTALLSPLIKFHHVLDIFKLFYVNKFANHHAFKITY